MGRISRIIIVTKMTEHSIEFFPPRGEQRLREVIDALLPLQPAFASVTFGAGGSTRERTFDTVRMIQAHCALEPVPHLSCISSTRDGIHEILQRYRDQGIKRIVALRGDLPEGMENPGEFHYANELVAFIKDFGGFEIHVAAYPEPHPQAISALTDLEYFVRKVKAGADVAITQYFYNNNAYYQFVEDAQRRGVDIPIVAGVMPFVSYAQVERFSKLCGAEIPRFIRERMAAYADDAASQIQFGIELVTRQCQDLLRQGVPGLHFYTLNQTEPTKTIWENLGLSGQ